MKIIFFVLLVIIVALVAMIAYLPWWISAAAAVTLLLGGKFLGGRVIESLFSMPFKAKGAVLRGAVVEIHAITPVTHADATRKYFIVDATVKPVTDGGGAFQLWEPGELQLAGPDAKPQDNAEDEEICRIERVEIETEGRFAADEGMKYGGPTRLRLTLAVVPGTSCLQFRYYFELFGGFTLSG